MRRSEGVGLRLDPEMRAAIEDLGARLGTDNISAIIRIGFMAGYREISDVPAQIARQSYREGVRAGVAAFKAKLEEATAAALEEAPDAEG